MKNIQAWITGVIGSVGAAVGLQNVNDVLNIILIILSIANLLWLLASRIIKHIKDKEYEKVNEDLTQAIHDIEELKDKNKEDK